MEIILNATDYVRLTQGKTEPELNQFRPALALFYEQEYLKITVHSHGIKPKFKSLSHQYSKEIKCQGWTNDYQNYIENHILNRFPNINSERFNWLCSVYPDFSRDLFLMAMDEIRGAIFQETNYDYMCSNENTSDFLYQKSFFGLDFFDFVKNVLTQQIVDDPNGYALVYPYTHPLNGIEPRIKFVFSKQIIFENDFVLAFKSDNILTVIDQNTYTEIEIKDGKVSSNKRLFEHNFGAMPARKLGGHTQIIDNKLAYVSYFSGGAGWANAAIRQFIDTEAYAKDLIGVTQVLEPTCSDCGGHGKNDIPCEDGQLGCKEICKKCNGRGTISRALGDVLVVPDTVLDQNVQAVKYHTPDTRIIEVTSKRFEDLYKNFKMSLYLEFTEQAQSGAAKLLDMQKMFKFVSQFSNNLFDIATDLLVFVDAYLQNGTFSPESISVKRPTQFALKTQTELQDELIKLLTAKSPAFVVAQKYNEINSSLNSGKLQYMKNNFLKRYDPYFYYSYDVKERVFSVTRQMSVFDFTKSMLAVSLLDNLIDEKGTAYFSNNSFETIAKELDTKVNDAIPKQNEQMIVFQNEGQ